MTDDTTQTWPPHIGTHLKDEKGDVYTVTKKRELKKGTRLTLFRSAPGVNIEAETHPLSAMPTGWSVVA